MAAASVYDYTFYKPTRISDDLPDVSQRTIQNAQYSTYMLDNFRPSCPMKSAIDFATSLPNVNFTGSHQVGIGGCNIDENSSLLLTDMSKPKCRISLMQRPFVTVPFLGRGQCNPILEAQMQQGDAANNRKSINPTSEVSYIQYSHTPMLPSLEATITNPANLIENVAANGWIRGGLSSRELTRDKDYTNNKKNVGQGNLM
jgi:hypothetical protein